MCLLCAAPVKHIYFVREKFDLDERISDELRMKVKEGEDLLHVCGHLLMRVTPIGQGAYEVHKPKVMVRSWEELVEGASYLPADGISELIVSRRGTDPYCCRRKYALLWQAQLVQRVRWVVHAPSLFDLLGSLPLLSAAPTRLEGCALLCG